MKSTRNGELPISVLYVDDEPALLEIGKLFLERGGDITVRTAADAKEAIQLSNEDHFNAIVSDYQMPGMNGIAFLKHLRQSGNTIPFIIFTGKGREEVVIEALNSGADFYLQKGGDPGSQYAELANMIHTAVSHKNAERIAKESEKRLYDIIQFLPDPTFAIDSSGIVIAWNQAIEEMTGVFAKDMIGKGNYEYAVPFYGERRPILIDLVSISDEELLQSKYTSVRRDGDVLIAETSLPRPLGRYAVLSGKASPLYNESGDVVGAIESIRDYTEQRRFEEKLQESEERYRLTLDAANDGIWDWDYTTGNAFFSSRWYTMLGYEPDELPGSYTTWRSLLHPDDIGGAEECIQNYIREGKGSYWLEFRMQTKDGGWRWILSRGKIVTRDAEGRSLRLLGTHTDITEQKRAGFEAERNKKLLEAMLDGIPDIIGLQLPDHTIIRYNRAGYQILGLTPEEVEGKKCYEIIGRSSPCENCATTGAILSKKQETVDRYIPELGRFMECTSNPVLDENGEVELIIEVLHDITERKEAEQALQESEEKYRLIADNTADTIWIADLNLRIQYISPSVLKMRGYTPEEVMGQSLREMLTPESFTSVEMRFVEEMALEATGEADPDRTIPIEFEKYRRDGSTIQVENAVRFLRDQNGRPTGIIGVSRDITERRLTEERFLLKDAAVRASLNGLAITDLSGRVIYANPAYLAMWGASEQDEVLGESILSSWTEEEKGLEIADSILKKGSWSGEVQGTRRDGSEIIVELATSLVRNASGTPIAMMGSCIDITERKKEERALQTANKKLQILSSVTRHDILNKIMAIDGYIWLKREDEGDEQQDTYLADIEVAVKSIERQIEFTRQYENLGVQSPIWLLVRDLIEAIDDSQLPVLHRRCDKLAVFADPMIQKVFENLMENTIRHAEGASRVEIRCEERGDQLAIIWEDEGPGIPDDQKKRIFERGYGKHTGFGLFLSQEILAITRIDIQETGIYGKGARFEMLVPEGEWHIEGK